METTSLVILVAGNPGPLRYALVELLSSLTRIRTVLVADVPETALAITNSQQPDVVILNHELQGEWVELPQQLRACCSTICIAAITDDLTGVATEYSEVDLLLQQGASPVEVITALESLLA